MPRPFARPVVARASRRLPTSPSHAVRRLPRRPRLRPVALALTVGAGLLAAVALPLGAGSAHAALAGCRSDPLAFLSDGSVVQLSAAIAASAADIQAITYTLRIPVGTQVQRVIDTSGPLGLKETLQVQADDAPGTYDTTTAVTTTAGRSGVTATIRAVAPLLAAAGHASVAGQDGQALALHLALRSPWGGETPTP